MTFVDLDATSTTLIELTENASSFIVFEPQRSITDRLEMLGGVVFRTEAEMKVARRMAQNMGISRLISNSCSIGRRCDSDGNVVRRLSISVER